MELDFDRHIKMTRRIIGSIKERKKTNTGQAQLSDIQKRDWFERILDLIDVLARAVIKTRIVKLKYSSMEAALEAYCSIIIFSDNAYYRKMTNDDVINLRFPLSRKSRKLIHEGSIKGGQLKFVQVVS